jgi:ATP-dependent DNA ligase
LSSIRHSTHAESTFLYALDLIELSGDDLRRDPLEVRKAALASIVAKAQPGIRPGRLRPGASMQRPRRARCTPVVGEGLKGPFACSASMKGLSL